MHNTGSVDSVTTAVFMAGDKRYACHHSSFHFHGVRMNFGQNSGHNLDQLQESVSRVREDENKIAGILIERSQLQEGEIRKLFRAGETKPPAFAVSKGVVDEIREFRIPAKNQLISFNFQ